ncbi:MAG: RNA polymerase sigma factor [Phycisphaerae bacterium]
MMPTDGNRIDTLTLQGMLMERAAGLRRLIRRRFPAELLSLHSEEDVLQEIWTSAFHDISGFYPGGHDSFDRWLTRVAKNRIINLVKSARRQKRGLDHQPARSGWNPRSSYCALFDVLAGKGRTPSREAFSLEAVDAVQAALAELSDDRRRAIQMRFIEGRSLEETATRMGKTKLAIRSLAYNGIDQMRALLGHESHFFSDAPSTTL